MAVELKLLEEELTTYDVYLATLETGPYQLPGIRVLADARLGEAILGRDVLNQLVVTLNGPGATVDVET